MFNQALHCCTEMENSSFVNTNASSPSMDGSVVANVDIFVVGIVSVEVLIASFGVIGNVLVITVLQKLGKKKQPGDYYLQNLAIADVGILLFAFPFFALRVRLPFNWPLGEFACRYLYPLPEVSHGVSVWLIAVIAVERYYKLVTLKSLGVNRLCGSRRAIIVVACVWMMSFFVFCLPIYFVVDYHGLTNGGAWCGLKWPSWDHNMIIAMVYTAFLTLFSYILPLMIISMTYLSVSRTIRRSSIFNKAITLEQHGFTPDARKPSSTIKAQSTRLRQNKRARKILTPLVLVFAITMLPLNFVRLTVVIRPSLVPRGYYKHVTFALALFVLLNSSLNPVIYSIVSKSFRFRMKNLFLRR